MKEVSVPGDARDARGKRPVRTVTVNMVESPLGWLRSRGHLTARQYDAGEQLRLDWEAAQMAPRVTMRWDPAPIGSGRAGGSQPLEPAEQQLKAKERFDAAIGAAGAGLSDILWRVVCAGEGMREAETALGWPARAGKLVLTLALDRVADFYRLR
ncbi:MULTISPECIES: DUF6456 domain-containing protein [Sphingomonas]|uniref:DUF6456 domain-containing protein n=1 Tax=Sphingomonas TaxID=13687 RepID=UPI001F075893|nr:MULTISPECIES: DUF6456 domain-containing protein [Sphingomonas]